jgi:hypothetical protein
MVVKRAVPATVVALALTAAWPLAASAAQEGSDPHAKAQFKGELETSPGATSGTLRVRYRCNVGDTLWISAKQTASGKKDVALEQEGSSQIAAAWWQSHRNPITCDGRSHKQTFTLDTVEPGSKGHLVDGGRAYIQFCVTNGEDLTLSVSGWVRTDTDD